MNLGDANIVLRPRTALESVDLAFPFIARVGGRRYAVLAAIALGPPLAACLALAVLGGVGWVALWLGAAPLALWLQGVFTTASGEAMFATELEPAAVLRAFWRRALPYTVALVVSRGLIALSAVTIVFLPFVWGHFLFVPEAVLLEGASVSQALSRSGRLGRANRGSMLELLCSIAAILALGVIGAESFGHAVFDFTLKLDLRAGDLFDEGGSVYAVCGLFAVIPLSATVRFLSYIDGRSRRDAWDVQVKFQRIVHEEKRAA